jgi:hypothetical protein
LTNMNICSIIVPSPKRILANYDLETGKPFSTRYSFRAELKKSYFNSRGSTHILMQPPRPRLAQHTRLHSAGAK